MIRSTCCIGRDPPSPKGQLIRLMSVPPDVQEGPSRVPFPITSWSSASRLSKPEDAARLQAIFSGDTTCVEATESKLKSKKSYSAIVLVKARLRKHLSCGSDLKKIDVPPSVGCSEEEIERRKELRLSRQMRIRADLSNAEIYDDDANSFSSVPNVVNESESFGNAFTGPDVDNFWSKELMADNHSIVEPESENGNTVDAEPPNFPLLFEEEVRNLPESTAPCFEAHYNMQQSRISMGLIGVSGPVSNALATESPVEASNLKTPPTPVILPQRLPSIGDTVARRTLWRLSFVSDRRSSMLRQLSQEHHPPSPDAGEPSTGGAHPVKLLISQGPRVPSDLLFNHSDGPACLANSQSRPSTHIEENWGGVDGNVETHSLALPTRDIHHLQSRIIANFASCPQLPILNNLSRPRRNSYAGVGANSSYSRCGPASRQEKSATPTQSLHNTSRNNVLIHSTRRARRTTIQSSLIASETSSFRHREFELEVIKTRFPELMTNSGKTPMITRFKEEFESTTPEPQGKQSILSTLQLSKIGRISPGTSSPVPDIYMAQASGYGLSDASPVDVSYTSKPESLAVQIANTGGILKRQVLLERSSGMWKLGRQSQNVRVKGVSESLSLKKSHSSVSELGGMSLKTPSLRVSNLQMPIVDEANRSMTMVDVNTLDSVDSKLPMEDESRRSNMKFQTGAAIWGRRVRNAIPPPSWVRFSCHTGSEPTGDARLSDQLHTRDSSGNNLERESNTDVKTSNEDMEVTDRLDGHLLIRVSRRIRSTVTKLSTRKSLVLNRAIQQRRSTNAGIEIQDPEINKNRIEVPPMEAGEDVEQRLSRREKMKKDIHDSDFTDGFANLSNYLDDSILTEISIADPSFYSDCLVKPCPYEEGETVVAAASANAVENPKITDNRSRSLEPLVNEKFSSWTDSGRTRNSTAKSVALRKSTLDFKDDLETMERFEMERALRTAEEAWGE